MKVDPKGFFSANCTGRKIGVIFLFLLVFSLKVNAQNFGNLDQLLAGVFTGEEEQHASGRFYAYGYDDHVYYQFTGLEDFKLGVSPDPGFNFHYDRFYHTTGDFGVAWGLGWSTFSSTTESTTEQKITSPDIKMSLSIYDANLTFAYIPPEIEFLRFFFSAGWGWVDGNFLYGSNQFNDTTNFYGLATYRDFGVDMGAEEIAFQLILRNFNANQVTPDQDPFNQAEPGKDFLLNFNGAMGALCGVYRF